MAKTAEFIRDGNTVLGIEFGSTRIKAVLIGEDNGVIATGEHGWENKLIDGYWTYSVEDILSGLQQSYANLCANVYERYRVVITSLKAIGISAMMHGYMVFDKCGKQLVPFRTWRNATTATASEELSKLFDFNIPQRWSIAHLYQAILNGEPHVKDIDYLTTLAGYVHLLLTGCRTVGLGEGSGIVPLDADGKDYNSQMIAKFEALPSVKKMPWKLRDILPNILSAGECAGYLSEEGAKLLDISGNLKSGIPLCPPEGDAQTGMIATDSIKENTGNISAGTSVFAMLVLNKPPNKPHKEIDVVVTPTGKQVAMVHCNNCSGDINAWIDIFARFSKAAGIELGRGQLYELLFNEAAQGDYDCSDMVAYNFFSGEHIIDLPEGRLLLMRSAESRFNLANLMRASFYSAFCVLKKGVDILNEEEKLEIKSIVAHGGLFKVKKVAQQILADVLNTPISVSDTAGEGGAWGMAILAAYMLNKDKLSLEKFLTQKVFCNKQEVRIWPNANGVKGFGKYYQRFFDCLSVEEEAIRRLR